MAWRANISRNLLEVTIRCSNSGAESAAARAFILKHYPGIMALNPEFPFLVRPHSNPAPVSLKAVFHAPLDDTSITGRGVPAEKTVDLEGMSMEEIDASLKQLVTEGAQTPEVEVEVPAPIGRALENLVNGNYEGLVWPGAALGYDKTKLPYPRAPFDSSAP
uniref:Ribosomal protein/NADH dehydrogenase domain-containing protein n=1 Tax=Rhizochromulina marina TaxID=1034831 RepID=A0A7S2S5P5_9STRA|mmetsp:Transcript_25513/g.74393  ORF Transcript_25513/g.74393 Transcript_25513/m.74393 type:complete len:162 (+) Transcript_25513:67-552(+)|eukprot:CAMPEP_0118963336 /NCGR_PEP_ID=MMETSP1173-20130426/1281_1 /TAXON_ID=1034831 /ORGANISM="Rhizochromulina marina cf, Strain CCMP1243" /LENGTH=161 /DNA_ID=CAMNT_0006911659 /DNA_START=67 /DNA_END=552 /DNA_ORIENTATION=+